MLGLGNESFFQEGIVEVIQPHFLNNAPLFDLVILIGTLSHDVHLQVCL
jgi:hypothetical protein